MYLNRDDFIAVLQRTPLVSMDLIVRNRQGQILLGLRKNEPAKGFWFVPGGRILKDERLDDAFQRLTQEELGLLCHRKDAVFRGVFEHLYETNFAGKNGVSTHYVVLAHELEWAHAFNALPITQHDKYEWCAPDAILQRPDVHENVKAYFR